MDKKQLLFNFFFHFCMFEKSRNTLISLYLYTIINIEDFKIFERLKMLY